MNDEIYNFLYNEKGCACYGSYNFGEYISRRISMIYVHSLSDEEKRHIPPNLVVE
jgi:hypothetical protein